MRKAERAGGFGAAPAGNRRGQGRLPTRFQHNTRPGIQDRPALTFLVVADGSPIASFTSSVAAAMLAECVKRDDLSRAVVILVEEADAPTGIAAG